MRRTPLLLALTALAGCATAGPADLAERRPPPSILVQTPGAGREVLEIQPDESAADESIVDAPADELWTVLAEVYAGMGLSVNSLSTDTRMMGLQNVLVRRIAGKRVSTYLGCGMGPMGQLADRYEVRVTLMTQLAPTPGGSTVVRTRMQANAKDGQRSSHLTQCASNGRLEREIGEALRLRHQAAAPPRPVP